VYGARIGDGDAGETELDAAICGDDGITLPSTAIAGGVPANENAESIALAAAAVLVVGMLVDILVSRNLVSM
jgi:heptaprenylglyceryl phosphate synthase